jgi:hypothetical protein
MLLRRAAFRQVGFLPFDDELLRCHSVRPVWFRLRMKVVAIVTRPIVGCHDRPEACQQSTSSGHGQRNAAGCPK